MTVTVDLDTHIAAIAHLQGKLDKLVSASKEAVKWLPMPPTAGAVTAHQGSAASMRLRKVLNEVAGTHYTTETPIGENSTPPGESTLKG
jgi:hypothetical protein